MSEQTITGAESPEHDVEAGHDGPAHPSDRSYVGIALILAVLTAAEVATYYFEEELGAALVPGLIVMMIVKFALVVAWFMHLRFDSNLFTRVFVSGLVLAVGVYVAALAMFRYFG